MSDSTTGLGGFLTHSYDLNYLLFTPRPVTQFTQPGICPDQHRVLAALAHGGISLHLKKFAIPLNKIINTGLHWSSWLVMQVLNQIRHISIGSGYIAGLQGH